MKSVMSLEMYKKLKLKNLNTTSISHIVGASGKSLGARGRTKCEVNINGKIFYKTFIVCKHLKRPIILGRDFCTIFQYKIALVFPGKKQTHIS